MSSNTQRQNMQFTRPAWLYPEPKQQVNDVSILEMLESIRNVMEDINRSQMLQCDVAHAIKDLLTEMRGLRRDLKKGRGKNG